MAQRQNYGFQKRQKEIEKQKKKAAKAEKKRERREAADESGSVQAGESDDESDPAEPRLGLAGLEPALRGRLVSLCDEGWDLWARFDTEVRQQAFHPFVAADYPVVLEALISLRRPGARFLEWGSATGVVTIMADLLGFDAYGIEIDADLVDQARELARRTGSSASFTAGSFVPTGYIWRNRGGDARLGTIADGESGYLQLGMSLSDFDIVFGYPWMGEEAVMLDLMKTHGRRGGTLLVQTESGVKIYRAGRVAA